MSDAEPKLYLCEYCETKTPKTEMRVKFVQQFAGRKRGGVPRKVEVQVRLCAKCAAKEEAPTRREAPRRREAPKKNRRAPAKRVVKGRLDTLREESADRDLQALDYVQYACEKFGTAVDILLGAGPIPAKVLEARGALAELTAPDPPGLPADMLEAFKEFDRELEKVRHLDLGADEIEWSRIARLILSWYLRVERRWAIHTGEWDWASPPK